MASDSPSQCGQGTPEGTYMSSQSGTLNGLPLVQVNRIVCDGMGGITGNGTVVVNGVPTIIPLITATYTVDADCKGTLTSVPAGLISELRHQGEWEPSLLHRDGSLGRGCHDLWRSGEIIEEITGTGPPRRMSSGARTGL
jgi:hypothetical protein